MNEEIEKNINGKVDTNKFIRLIKKFSYAFNGLKLAVTNHTSFITHTIMGTIACIMSVVFKINMTEFMFILSAIFFVLIAELVNTAIEESINLYTKDFHRGAMISKDSAAAAVLLASFYAVIVGGIIFIPKIIELFK